MFFKVLPLVFLFTVTLAVPRIRRGINEPRIIGGQLARPGQFPFAAAIEITTPTGKYFCTGALITLEWVVTAAQCVDGATLFTITLGATDLADTGSNVQKVATEHYVIYPEYNRETLEHDIGLIKFREQVQWTFYVSRVMGFDDISGERTYMTLGWGQTSDTNSSLSDHLYYVELTILENDECKGYYGSAIVDGMVCGAGNYNEGTCIGDSGAPLIYDYYGSMYHVGVSSFLSGNGCESVEPSGFTRTRSYCDWVKNETASHTYSCI